ncbi:hypothetical protein GGH92_004849 [Coemansia sp. RSA 2673]|nr:hypothetical protein GGH92_004849 [Coemansia sp. RSA 2673]
MGLGRLHFPRMLSGLRAINEIKMLLSTHLPPLERPGLCTSPKYALPTTISQRGYSIAVCRPLLANTKFWFA